MNARGFLYQPNLTEHIKDWINQPYTFYDAFNPGARKLFWAQIDTALFAKGIDAWWMDATEPDLMPSPPTLEGQQTHMNPTFLGTGSRMLNAYALMNSEGVYSGQRQAAPNQRVFILTRSGFAGLQRASAVPWSGDITSTWTAMAKQIPAGLGASISGLPYWTMDTGGYTMQRKFSQQPMTPDAQDEWRELNARWFQYSTFTPLLRVHGELRPREMWTLGDDTPAFNAELSFDRLRYALFPYIYSLAGWTTQSGYTMMRPLVMDFPADRTARELPDEYMFGPALLVAPITQYKQRARPVYLPASTQWYDYWTGRPAASGRISAAARSTAFPSSSAPDPSSLTPRPCSTSAKKPSDPTTLYVYAGANASFTSTRTRNHLRLRKGRLLRDPHPLGRQYRNPHPGKRTGSFDGMLDHRTFNIVLVSAAHPSAYLLTPTASSPTPATVKSAQYTGAELHLHLR